MPPDPTARRAPRPLARFAWFPAISVAACLGAWALLHLFPGPSERLEGVLTDFRNVAWMVLRGPRDDEPPSPVTVVDVDERTLEALGLYGEGYRAHHARMVDFLSRHHAGAIVFDFLFKTSDGGDRDLERTRRNLEDAGIHPRWDGATWNRLRASLDVSGRLERAVADAPQTVLAAQLGDTLDYPNRSDWTPKASRDWQQRVWEGTPALGERLASLRTLGTLDNIYPALAHAAPRLGLANMEPDPDGKVRRLQLLWGFPGREIHPADGGALPAAYPVLALQAGLRLLGRTDREIAWDGAFLDLGAPLRVWKDAGGRLRTSAPGLTWGMCRAYRALREGLDSLAHLRTGITAPTEDVIVERTPDGRLRTRLAYPDTLDERTTLALAALAPDTAWIGQVPSNGEPAAISADVAIRHLPEGFALLESDPAGRFTKVATLSARSLRIFLDELPAALPHGIDSLAPGRSVALSVWTEAWWDRARGRLATSLLPLRGSSLRALLELPEKRLSDLRPGDTLSLGDPVRIPTDRQGAMLLPYGAPSRRAGRRIDQSWIRHVSYLDVLEGRYDPGQVPGRVFLIGSSASALADFVEVPVERRHPGVDVQALALHSIVSGDFLRPAPAWTDPVLPLALALAAGLCTAVLAPGWAMAAVVALLLGWFGLSVAAFDRGWWTPLLPGMAGGAAAAIAAMGLRYVLEERRRIFLQNSFKTYISPELIDQMVATGAYPRLGGEEREITAFFTDIQGFSTFSERIGSPTRLVELVNEYLSEMTRILTRGQGTLDKYIGDAIVAMYGAPVALDDHARRAVEAAVAMQERLADLRRKWQDEGDKWPEIVHHMRMRIGLNSGPIVTGNMGSELRMNYTMMGDDVNLAARLESASKQYGVFILASDATVRAAGPGWVVRELDSIRVVGKSEPVVVHEIVGRETAAPPSWKECVERFAAARRDYVEGRFARALEGFEACKPFEPWYGQPGVKNCPSDVFAARCRHLVEHPPATWDAVFTATEK